MNTRDPLFPGQQANGVLRLVTAGSVDDGKSTLIGRLLLDSKGVFADQLRAISGSRYSRAPADALDLALLTDGLEAEREQGITIDVAYRYFATPARKFIIADAPGHEQYTRNMVTGASTADAAVLLVDAARAADGQLLPQTRRHATLARLLGLQHTLIAVNKMDQVAWRQDVFERIQAACQDLARELGLPRLPCVPLSALHGDNVVQRSTRTPWYAGAPLLTLLENLPLRQAAADARAARFFVQWVARHEGSTAQAFRGYAGQLQGGHWRVGDAVRALPSGETAHIRELRCGDDTLQAAGPGQSILVRLDREIDLSRGDLLASGTPPQLASEFDADLCWLDRTALNFSRWYWLKQGARLTRARVTEVHSRRDARQLDTVAGQQALDLNDIGRVRIRAHDALALDDYDQQHATGAFILIDEASHQTAAAGMVRLASGTDTRPARAAH